MPKAHREMSVSQLEKLLENRKLKAVELVKRRKELQKELTEIDRQLAEIMGTVRITRRRQPKNDRSLKAHVMAILRKSKKGFSMAELQSRILDAGYKSASSNFRNVLYQCLYNSPDVMYEPSSGCYRIVAKD